MPTPATRTPARCSATSTPASVARDMDVIRAVLGDDKINYLGYSYGTYLGTMYAELFPEKVGKMVLDGAVDPSVERPRRARVPDGAASTARCAPSSIDCHGERPDCPFPGARGRGDGRRSGDARTASTANGLVASDGRDTRLGHRRHRDRGRPVLRQSLWPDLTDRLHRPVRRTTPTRRSPRPTTTTAATPTAPTRTTRTTSTRPSPAPKATSAPTASRHARRNPGAAGEGADPRRLLRLRRHVVLDALCSNWPYPVAGACRPRSTPRALTRSS